MSHLSATLDHMAASSDTAPAGLCWQAAPEIAVAFRDGAPVGHTYRRFSGDWRARRHNDTACADFKTLAEAAGFVADTTSDEAAVSDFAFAADDDETPVQRRRRLCDIAAVETVQAAASLLVQLHSRVASGEELVDVDAVTVAALEAAETLAVSRWERTRLRRALKDVQDVLHDRPRHEWRTAAAGELVDGDVVRVYRDAAGMSLTHPAVSQDHSGRFAAAEQLPWLVEALSRPVDALGDVCVRLELRCGGETAVMDAHPRQRVEVSKCHSSQQPALNAARVEALRSLVLIRRARRSGVDGYYTARRRRSRRCAQDREARGPGLVLPGPRRVAPNVDSGQAPRGGARAGSEAGAILGLL